MKSPYEILGVKPSASEDEIKKAYKKISFENHPDRNNGDEKKAATFREATEAFQAIQKGEVPKESSSKWENSGFPDLDELFKKQKQREQERRNPTSEASQANVSKKRGSDISMSIRLTLEEVVSGCKKEVFVGGKNYQTRCSDCEGVGGWRHSSNPCLVCSGTGRDFVYSINQPIGKNSSCPSCDGRGWNPRTKCSKCAGKGFVGHEEKITVTVPPGMLDGQQLRIAGRGTPGAPPGDLYISIETLEHPNFRRDGRDLHCELNVSVFTTFIGGMVTMANLDGSDVRLEIPPMTEPDVVCKVPEFGIQTMKGKGDLYVKLKVIYPKRVSDRAKKLMDELLEEIGK